MKRPGLATLALLGCLASPLRAQDSAGCPAVDSVARGLIAPHSYLLGWYDAARDTTHLEGGGTEPTIHVGLRVAFPGRGSSLPQIAILDVLLGDPYVEPARTAPDTTRLLLLVDDSLQVRTFGTGHRYHRMDPYPFMLQAALSARGYSALLDASRARLIYGADTIPARSQVIEGFHRLASALRCAPAGIPRSGR